MGKEEGAKFTEVNHAYLCKLFTVVVEMWESLAAFWIID